MEYHKTQKFFADSNFVEMDSKKSSGKKLWAKNYTNFEFLGFALFRLIFSITFFETLFEPISRIWGISKKFCVFETPYKFSRQKKSGSY